MDGLEAPDVLDACERLARHRGAQARAAVAARLLDHVDAHTDNVALLGHITAEALLRRVDRRLVESRNIYVERYDIPQIEMFYRMTQAYPHVSQGHAAANHLLVRELAQAERASWLEIGVGRGRQVHGALQALAAHPGRLRAVEVVAVDPDPENLAAAQALLEGGDWPFAVRVRAVEGLLEHLPPELFRGVAESAPVRVANAAFAFHHANHAPGDVDQRTRLLAHVRLARPHLLTLVEPDSDHDVESLPRRFRNGWRHFGTVFELLDESDLSPELRFSIKETFFGRELRDLFGVSDAFRCERHESALAWVLRLLRAGYRPAPVDGVPVELPAHSGVEAGEGVLRFGYRGTPLLAVLAFRGVP